MTSTIRSRARKIIEDGLQARPAGLHAAGLRSCAAPGCCAHGEYRAPRSRDSLREYQWLCLAHVREFNQRWDYFKDMGPDQIEAHRRGDSTWHRPTWPMGTRAQEGWQDGIRIDDPFDILRGAGFTSRRSEPPARPRGKFDEQAAVLGLAAGFDLDQLKRRYKELAKRHHPDLHGGDKQQEERLKEINAAYTWLVAHMDGH